MAVATWGQPNAFTDRADFLSLRQSTLRGVAVANGEVGEAWFEWGGYNDYTNHSPATGIGDGEGLVRVSSSVDGLEPDNLYYFRLVVSNASGVVYGGPAAFATGTQVGGWGIDSHQQISCFRGRPNMRSLAGGANHTLGLYSDGTLVAFCRPADRTSQPFFEGTVPPGLDEAIAIAAAGNRSLAVRRDGTVIGWQRFSPYIQTNLPPDLTNVIAVAASSTHSLALCADGKVVAWGDDSAGVTDVPGALSNVVAISAGKSYSLALQANGVLSLWRGDAASYWLTNIPPTATNIARISAGPYYCLALRSDGVLFQWGIGETPTIRTGFVGVAQSSAGIYGIRPDGRVTGWGSPFVPTSISNVVDLACGDSHVLARIRGVSAPFATTHTPVINGPEQATLYGAITPNGFGTTAWFEWGTSAAFGDVTAAVEAGEDDSVRRIGIPVDGLSPGLTYHCRLVASNEVGITHGQEVLFSTGQKLASTGLNWPGSLAPLFPADLTNIVSVDGGRSHTIALLNDGTVRVWWLPDSSSPSAYQTVTNLPPGLTNVVAVSAGAWHCLALKDNGTVIAWGYNATGQTNVPADLTNVVAIAAGAWQNLALTGEGQVVQWGNYSLPPELMDYKRTVAIATSGDCDLALRNDGVVIQWPQSGGPPGNSNIVGISQSVWNNYAIRKDGTVVNWKFFGAYGTYPPPEGLSNVVSVAGGWYHTHALKSDGTIVAWGDGYYGGTNDFDGVTNVSAIGSGDQFNLALAPNSPPLARSIQTLCPAGEQWVFTLQATDPNNDSLSRRVASLPELGTLYQYTDSGPGEAITHPNTPISDPMGRVIYVPEAGGIGAPYSAFTFVANDGEYDSLPITNALNVVPRPVLHITPPRPQSSLGTSIFFDGISNITYRLYSTTNLSKWASVLSTNSAASGTFQIDDPSATNQTQRFYRLKLE